MRTTARLSILVLSISGLLLACPEPSPSNPDAGCDPTDPQCELCEAATCDSLGAECGIARDGCGGLLNCGDCASGTCGGDGVANKCGTGPCVPLTACPEGACGTQSDGCSGELACGECAAPLTCGGGGRDGLCGCAAESDEELCNRLGAACGTITATDACEVTRAIDCGGCPDGQTCGADAANQCGCKPATCLNRCGTIDDGCGGTLQCSCTAPQTCGGGGVEGVCGCTRLTCQQVNACGLIPDGCGGNVRCGCTAPLSCGGGEGAGQCGCTPTTCEQQGVSCGEAYDGCGHMLDCGSCSGTQRVRIMAANITSGNRQSYDPGEGIRIFQALKPDVVLIQEFSYGDDSANSMRIMVDTAFAGNFYYYRETNSSIPNGIISRFPIVESGEWDDTIAPNRDYAWARIDLPGPRDLWAVSVHLLTSNAGERTSEANQIVAKVRSLVPANDYLVIGGDFNTGSRTESCITSAFKQVVVTTSPYPEDQDGNSNTNANRSEPYDWVLADQDLDQHETPVVIGANSFSSGLVFDSREYSPLSAVSPVLRADSDAVNMQHMAVVRDFLVPRQ